MIIGCLKLSSLLFWVYIPLILLHPAVPENFLLWYKIIVRTFSYDRAAGVTYKVVQEVVQEYLTTQESTLFNPILQLNQVVLG